MRITITTRIFAPEPAAAAYRLTALAETLADEGNDVSVLTSSVPEGSANPGHRGVRVHRAPVIRDATGQVRGYLQYLSFDVPLFFRLLFGTRSDVVVTEPPPTTGFVVRVAAALRRTPYVYFAADIWSDASESTGAPAIVVRFVRWLERRALRGAAHVIAVTDGVAHRVRELARHDRVTVVPNGVDTRVFTPDGPVLEGPPIAVYAGTTSEWQGADVFVRAMPAVIKSVPDARLVFLGQGSAWEGLKRLADEVVPGAVEFHDLVPPEDAATWLRSARVGLVSLKPGQGYDFAFPTKVYATLACGTPVVYAGPGPARDVIDRERLGIAVDYDVHAVESAIADILIRPRRGGPRERSSRSRLGLWVKDNASIQASASAAACVVIETMGTRERR